MRPTATNIGANIPAFLSKLWRMVNDPETDHLICWSPGGHSFIIQNQAQFWYNLLPIYYKHNNMSSFIRQLNMYGFHKVSADNGGLDCDKDEIKFFHPFFQQDQPNLMKHIKRKIASSKSSTTTSEDNKVNNVDQIAKVLVDVKQLRGRQESVDNQLAAMKQENAALWRELALLRQKHMKQQQIVNKLIHFLVTIVQPSRSGLGGLGVKRRYPLMINDSRYTKTSKTDSSSDGPTIHELDQESALTDSLLLNEVCGEEPEETSETDVKVDSPPSSANNLIDSDNVLLDIPIIEDADTSHDDSLNTEILLVPDPELENSGLATNNQNSSVVDLLNESELNADTNAPEFQIKDNDLCEYMDLNELPKVDEEEPAFEQGKSTNQILNPDMGDAMISNIAPEDDPAKKTEISAEKEKNVKDLTVATRYTPELTNFKVNTATDLDTHLETTQGELETIKDMLFDGYSLDANALLGNEVNVRFDGVPLQLFNPDEDFPLDVPQLSVPEVNRENTENNYDPMMSGSELMAYNNTPFLLDFDNLFEDTSDTIVDSTDKELDVTQVSDDQINTPIVVKKEPAYPTTNKRTSPK